jgi:hypothetical protein
MVASAQKFASISTMERKPLGKNRYRERAHGLDSPRRHQINEHKSGFLRRRSPGEVEVVLSPYMNLLRIDGHL